jgi:hypothetical protein
MTQVTRIITMVTTAMTTSHTAISHTTDNATGFVDAIADIDGLTIELIKLTLMMMACFCCEKDYDVKVFKIIQ